MLIKELSSIARKKLSLFGFKIEDSIDREIAGGSCLGFFSFTPLMYAAYRGDLDLVIELVKSKAMLDTQDSFLEFTALMHAASQGKAEVVEYLLINDADIHHQSRFLGTMQNAYTLSKKKSCYSALGLWQRAQKITGSTDMDETHKIIYCFQTYTDSFTNYHRRVEYYIKTGITPVVSSKQELFDKIKSLNSDERACLTSMVKNYLPQCDSSTAEGNATTDSISTASRWALATGITAGMAHYQLSENIYSAAATGAFTGVATLFACHQYKTPAFVKMYRAREGRAQEFLKHISTKKSFSILQR